MAFGDILNKVGDVGNAASSYAGKIGSIVTGFSKSESTAEHIRDVYTNGFLSPDSIYRPNIFARAFDEPTYLTFRIEFNFFDPIRNIAYNNNNIEEGGLYYGTMYDYMPEPFLQEFGNVNADASNASKVTYGEPIYGYDDKAYGKSYSAEGYLRRNIGDYYRADMVTMFRDSLKDIQTNYPYYFTKISGLDSLTKVNPAKGKRLEGGVITINCYEALDLRITQLLQLYRKIVWDDEYQRWALPDMMRYFSMKIYISEMRLFHHVAGLIKSKKDKPYDFSDGDLRNAKTLPSETWYDKAAGITNDIMTNATALSSQYLGTNSTVSKVLDTANNVSNTAQSLYSTLNSSFTKSCISAINTVMPTIVLDCHMCEFDISDTFGYLTELSSSRTNEPVHPVIKIKVGQVHELHSYPLNNSTVPNSDGKYIFETLTSSTNTISDSALVKGKKDRFFKDVHIMSDVRNYIGNESFMVKKYGDPGKKTNSITDMHYVKNQTTAVQGIKGIVTSALGALDSYGVIKTKSNVIGNDGTTPKYISEEYEPKEKEMSDEERKIVGSISSATILQNLAKNIYESDAVKSSAVTEADRQNVAQNIYEEVLAEIINNKETDEQLRATANTVLSQLTKEAETERPEKAKGARQSVPSNIYTELNKA